MENVPINFLNQVQDVTAETFEAAVDRIVMLAEPINGPNSFNLETAAYGYITRNERVVLPQAYFNRIPMEIEEMTDFNIVELLTIAFYNFYRLRQANMNDETALFLSLYRARLIKLGYLLRTKEARRVTVDEVDYVNNAQDMHGNLYAAEEAYRTAFDASTSDAEKVLAFLNNSPASPFRKFVNLVTAHGEMFKYVTLTATQFAASTYLVFRQHGHHWKADLDQKYNTLWRATTLEKPNFVPGNNEIHRIAIHSFGLYILHEKFFALRDNSMLAETYVDRADVAPCGAAIVATCHAAISLMKSLPLWLSLYRSYKGLIDHLAAEASMLKNAKDAIKFHKNARLFGVQRHVLDTSSAAALAPVAKGFIKSMGDRVDMARQKTLDKRADQNPVVVDLVANVIFNIFDKIGASGDISRAIAAPEAAKSAPVATEVT
jgi:hypothetical protein